MPSSSRGTGGVGITGNEVRAACIQRGAERRLALQLSTGLYGPRHSVPWGTEKIFKLRRLANGDGEIEFAGEKETVPHDRLSASSRADASFAFGCFLDTATAVPRFGPIDMPASIPMTLTLSIVQLFPNASEKVHIEGSFAPDSSGGNGVNPAVETVALRLFKPDGSRIYPVSTDKMPAAMVPITGGWSISAAEKTRTGIQDLQILQTGDPAFRSLELRLLNLSTTAAQKSPDLFRDRGF